MAPLLQPSVRALAEADFTAIAAAFDAAGMVVRLPERGVLLLKAPGDSRSRPHLLLSVGIHGDETAPIEMVADLLAGLAGKPQALAIDLMVVVGNLRAIAQGKRFIDADLNRLFRTDRADLQTAAEAERADEIMRTTASFFGATGIDKWHFDLHTAIRPSRYPTFAVVPDAVDEIRRQTLLRWLGTAGIHAAILNGKSAGTFSAYTANGFGAVSATIELGRVGALGANDLSRFAAARTALDAFLRSGQLPQGEPPQAFRVARELIKHSDAFRMTCDRDTHNFTPLPPGALIAEDGDIAYHVGDETEYLVFPNPDVRPGLRAGLMVVAA